MPFSEMPCIQNVCQLPWLTTNSLVQAARSTSRKKKTVLSNLRISIPSWNVSDLNLSVAAEEK